MLFCHAVAGGGAARHAVSMLSHAAAFTLFSRRLLMLLCRYLICHFRCCFAYAAIILPPCFRHAVAARCHMPRYCHFHVDADMPRLLPMPFICLRATSPRHTPLLPLRHASAAYASYAPLIRSV